MDAWALDRWALRDSPWHRAPALSKIVAAGLGILAVSLAHSPIAVVAIALVWLSALRWARVPLASLMLLASYASLFAGLYALVSWEGEWQESVTLVLKAVGAAVAVLSIVTTTPYPRVFQALKPLLPRPLPDALLLTYRSLFLLLDRWSNLAIALRLRRGLSWRHPLRSLGNLSSGLGVLLLSALDQSEALYESMLLRGYEGVLARRAGRAFNRWSLVPLGLGALSLLLSLAPDPRLDEAALGLALAVLVVTAKRWR